MSPVHTPPVAPSGALILWDGDTPVQYSLEVVELTFEEAPYCRDRVELSALMGGEHFVDLAPKVKTVADLNLGMLNKARVRVTTEEGIHEGVLRAIATETTTTSYGRGHKTHHTDIELGIGNACVPAKATDLVEVIEEEEA